MTNKQHKEIHEGVNGNGNSIWLVVTVDSKTKQWVWIEKFESKKEAEAWLKYA